MTEELPGANTAWEDDEDDWFGEGSAFDSGEDLAAALFSLAPGGVTAGQSLSSGIGVYSEAPEDAPAYAASAYSTAPPAQHGNEFEEVARDPSAAPLVRAPKVSAESFQVTDRPGAPPSASSWNVRSQGEGRGRSGWGMRHSVQFLKMTEGIIKRLRQDAVEVAWEAAAVAMAQQHSKGRRTIRH